ncbi:DeoR/GlpR family DNA-binding transcription regulator [Oceanobacillus manasiensis]|uniref:DeoR/GlpR family DNA-binding transcription regulator n=1 Tax=Oceanobacillus manasiensis TaxID=586413 RepID=UPI0005AA3288|nr:DeoR/GlpR family DNA-binding transcription regulator [Oceanobacillus manasiensis]
MKMFVDERRNKILQLLNDKQRLTVKELANQIGVSEATLRTDLNKMENEGLLTRTHGGAILKDNIDQETSFSAREKKNKKEKSLIGKKAFQYVAEKQCILLDASSTALELARYLNSQPLRLTVVTSGIQTAFELKDNPDITVIMIGGVVTKKSTSIEGTFGLGVLDHVNIDVMFTSANGFSIEKGLSDFNLYEVELKKEMIKRAKKVIAIIDSSKIGKTSSAFFATIDQIDTLITEKAIEDELHSKIQNTGIKVISAD